MTDDKTTPPKLLIDAFRAAEQVTDIAVLMADEGFDTVTMRVLAAWERSIPRWRRPSKPCPDAGRPTAEAWKWLTSGWSIDYATISAAAAVARDVARERCDVLVHARLIYPDGSISKPARQAMQAAVASRLVRAGGKRRDKKDDEKSN